VSGEALQLLAVKVRPPINMTINIYFITKLYIKQFYLNSGLRY
jgi:hypothetical protein